MRDGRGGRGRGGRGRGRGKGGRVGEAKTGDGGWGRVGEVKMGEGGERQRWERPLSPNFASPLPPPEMALQLRK